MKNIIKPIIQLIGYIILVIAIFTGSVLAIFMPIIMFIIDSIMLATNKKDINVIKFMVSLIMMFTIMGIIILATDLLNFIILESIVQIILNIIEITTILPILKRNIKKILIILFFVVVILGIIISCIKLYKIKSFEKEIERAKELGKYIEINSYDSYSKVYGGLIKLDDNMSLIISR